MVQIPDVTIVYSLERFERFLPRCTECRRGLAMRILSVRPSVRSSVYQTRAL